LSDETFSPDRKNPADTIIDYVEFFPIERDNDHEMIRLWMSALEVGDEREA
jgi:hypothetical protein